MTKKAERKRVREKAEEKNDIPIEESMEPMEMDNISDLSKETIIVPKKRKTTTCQ